MDLRSYLAIIGGNKWIIFITVISTLAVAVFLTFLFITPLFTATTTLRIATASSGVVGYSDYMYADRLMNTYTKLATSRPVIAELAENLHLQSIPQIIVAPIPNTELIKISVESSDPVIAETSANTLAEILIDQGKELYSGGGKSAQEILSEQLSQAEAELNQARKDYEIYISRNASETLTVAAMNEAIQLKEKTYATLLEQYDEARLRETMRENLISVVEPAVLPLSPSSPNKPLNIGLGALVGLAGGIGLAFVIESLHPRLYSSRQIETASELNLIGKIPSLPRTRLMRLVEPNNKNMPLPFKEAFRRLHIQMLLAHADSSNGGLMKTFMITSSEPGEGKSIITTNLARVISQSGKKVIVVDCDFHLPKQHKINKLPNHVGVITVLNQETSLEETIHSTMYQGMDVLTSGPLPENPAILLSGHKMNALIKWLSKNYDIVLLDTPALLPLADASILAPYADGVIFVARRNYIREEAVREGCKHLADIKACVIGLVVNDAERNGSAYYGHN